MGNQSCSSWMLEQSKTFWFRMLAVPYGHNRKVWKFQFWSIKLITIWTSKWSAVSQLQTFFFSVSNLYMFHSVFSQTICIRQEAGMCCNKYTLCADTQSFGFDNRNPTAYTGTACTEDFIDFVGTYFLKSWMSSQIAKGLMFLIRVLANNFLSYCNKSCNNCDSFNYCNNFSCNKFWIIAIKSLRNKFAITLQ